MPTRTKIVAVQDWYLRIKNYVIFTIPNSIHKRLFSSMQFTDTHWQTGLQLASLAAFKALNKESKLKLSLETRNCGDVIIVHCQGRIVYRDEAVALAQLVGDFLENRGKIVLDLSGVSSIDSAGIGELVLLHTQARSRKAEMKYASPSPLVRDLLALTNVDSVLEIHPNLGDALAAFDPALAAAD
jgi:anti-sigma B factor antagonist